MQVTHTSQNNGILYARFHDDGRILSVGTKKRFTVYNVEKEPIANLFSSCDYESENFQLVEISGNWIFTVGANNDSKLEIWNAKEGIKEIEKQFSTRILSIRVNIAYILLCFEGEINVFSKDPFTMIARLCTPKNPTGAVSMTSSKPYYIAYPSRSDRGDFKIYDLESFQKIRTISEHESPITHLQFDHSGLKIASVSMEGKNIKVHSIFGDTEPLTLKRGLTRASLTIPSFSKDSKFLVCASERTAHIFLLDDQPQTSYFEEWYGRRANCTISLNQRLDSVYGFSEDSTRLYIVTSDGMFSKYSWDEKRRKFQFITEYPLSDDLWIT